MKTGKPVKDDAVPNMIGNLIGAMIEAEVKRQLAELMPVIAPVNAVRNYTPKQLAELTVERGVKRYSYYEMREACNHGRIKAEKTANGRWLVGQAEVDRVLSRGLE